MQNEWPFVRNNPHQQIQQAEAALSGRYSSDTVNSKQIVVEGVNSKCTAPRRIVMYKHNRSNSWKGWRTDMFKWIYEKYKPGTTEGCELTKVKYIDIWNWKHLAAVDQEVDWLHTNHGVILSHVEVSSGTDACTIHLHHPPLQANFNNVEFAVRLFKN